MSKPSDLLTMKPTRFIDFLKANSINRFYFFYDEENSKLVASHQVLQSIADTITNNSPDFAKHEGLFFQLSDEHDVLMSAFIHKTNRGQAAGGLRFWQYQSMDDFFADGMRLAQGMTRKNALANLWWGGGKGIMIHNQNFDKNNPEYRNSIYRNYGRFISSLNGCYITAEDVGTCEADMANIFSQTRFTTCIPSSFGGSGNPSAATALGVVCGMEAAIEFLNLGTLKNKTVAIQGMGNVAEPMMSYLFERGVKQIIAADINPELVKKVQNKYSNQNLHARLVDIGDNSILFEDCDILAPCATGAIINQQTIPKIQAKIICGAANNQLLSSESDSLLLKEQGITYVPDFLVNRMGIVNCADEQAGYVQNDSFFERHLQKDYEFSIYQTTLRVFKQSALNNATPAAIAIQLSDELAEQTNPIYGYRGIEIIRSLKESHWHNESP
ncbi:MAG: Glu/Leu/Phe/Val dehydrogenase dimerization domain-containing protein [Gammaproteobacteria bacterium]|jgi:glutamate dehydrogenase/leucine dehydrogenase|nr:Glu/Leu/Phe/Val dehydrogenase [Xanthomonadales bacterium]